MNERCKKLAFVKLFVEYLDLIEKLDEAERGRLLTAMLRYAKTGEEPELTGNEQFVFPLIKSRIDKDLKEHYFNEQ